MRVSGSFKFLPGIPADRRIAEIQNTLIPIKRLTRLVSLNFYAPKTRWQLFWLVFTALSSASVLGFLTFFSLYIKIRYKYNGVLLSIKLTDTIQMCFDYIQYLVDLFFVFKYGREISTEYFKQYANIDQILITINNSAIKERVIKVIAYFLVIWIVTSAGDFIAWTLSYGALIPTLYATSYIYLLLKIFTTLDLISHIMHVEFRMKCIVDQLRDCYGSSKHFSGDFSDPISNKHWFYCGQSKPENSDDMKPDWTLATNNHENVKWMSRCYLLLCEQCVFINSTFGTRILLNSLSLLIDMIRFTNIAVRLVVGTQPTLYASGYYPAAANIVRMVTCALVVGTLVSQCERAYRERDTALIIIDHTLVGKETDVNLRSELTDLRALIQSRPIQFHTAYFFRLEYGFLVSLISVMVTYTIILIQSLN